MRPTLHAWKRTGGLPLLVVALIVPAACGGPDTLVDGDMAFVDVNVLPMDGDRVLEEQAVIVDDGRIVAVGSVDEIGPKEGVEVIDGDGLYLMPGLTEMHGHLPSPRMSDIDIRNLLFLYIANGVTTVRAMQGDPSQFALRNQIEGGLLAGPQLSLAAFDAVARTAAEVGIPFGGHVPDVVGLRHALARGQSSIDHLDNYLQALVPVAAWPEPTPGVVGIGDLVEDVDESPLPGLVRATVAADAWVVPTMVLRETAFLNNRSSADLLAAHPEVRYMPPETVDRWKQAVDDRLGETSVETNQRVAELRRQVLLALHQGGANIALGTDSPQIFSVPGFAMHHEMAFYVDVGMTPYDALETGTRKPAEYFDATADFGIVAVGRRADLLLLTDNPLDDIGNVAKRAGVMVNGRWFPEEEIQQRLEEIAQFYGN